MKIVTLPKCEMVTPFNNKLGRLLKNKMVLAIVGVEIGGKMLVINYEFN